MNLIPFMNMGSSTTQFVFDKGFRSILDAMKSYAEDKKQHVPDIEVECSKWN